MIPQCYFLFLKDKSLGVVSKKENQENCEMVPVSYELKTFVTSESGFNSALEEAKQQHFCKSRKKTNPWLTLCLVHCDATMVTSGRRK